MKTLAALMVAGLVGCASTTAEDVSSSAADTSTPLPALLCFMPAGHPFNGNADVWTVRDDIVMKTTAFYWHGTPIITDDATGPSWTVMRESDTEIVALNASSTTVTIDVTVADARFHFYNGTVNVTGEPAITAMAQGCESLPNGTGLPHLDP